MKIQINTDNNIAGREELTEQAEATVKSTLGHLAEHIALNYVVNPTAAYD